MKLQLLLICLLAVALVSCTEEGAAPPEGPGESPPSTEESTGETDEEEAEPVGEAESDEDFVGLSLAEGEALARKRKLVSRTIEIDGEAQLATADYRPDRVNFSIEKGKIVKVTRG